MNREIKFRAWNTLNNEMWDCDKLVLCGLYLATSGAGVIDVDDDRNKQNHIIPLQFTGLKDKNGIEIYEGDILRVKSSSSTSLEIIHNGEKLTAYKSNYDIRTVVFYKGAFCLHNEITTERHEKESKYSGTTYSGTLQSMTYDNEIIGNVYENADILTTEA